jgi:peptidoglycan/LPS O-acetylase OafA/YrhL
MKSIQTNNRIAYLDGLRAIAILSVVLFHYYYTFPKNVQVNYGTNIGNFFLIKHGALGVMLFFSISGFVITLTLHNSIRPIDFFNKNPRPKGRRIQNSPCCVSECSC